MSIGSGVQKNHAIAGAIVWDGNEDGAKEIVDWITAHGQRADYFVPKWLHDLTREPFDVSPMIQILALTAARTGFSSRPATSSRSACARGSMRDRAVSLVFATQIPTGFPGGSVRWSPM